MAATALLVDRDIDRLWYHTWSLEMVVGELYRGEWGEMKVSLHWIPAANVLGLIGSAG